MPTELALQFRVELQSMRAALLSMPAELADVPWHEGGWTRKEILGHLMDSAANNRQRFVRAATEGSYSGPSYRQEAWVDMHGYQSQSWPTLLEWWQTENQILAAVVENIPADALDARCTVGENAPVSLRFLIEDYLAHHRGHLVQILSGTTTR
jgi:hypothetical protein